MVPLDSELAYRLVQEELFDLTLYRELHGFCRDDLKRMLGQLIPVEEKHVRFWQEFFKRESDHLDCWHRLKLRLVVWACRIFGPIAVQLVMEAIEINGIRKYLEVWKAYKNDPLGQAVREVLNDEFEHEDEIVSSATQRRIDPDSVRSMFLGFNDGMVEILGAISGFFAAFRQPHTVLVASACVAAAGAVSMAAGAYVGAKSEREIQNLERGKADFLGGKLNSTAKQAQPMRDAWLVGISYFLGAVIPALPMALGARTLWSPLAVAGVAILLVSALLAFLSGIEIRRRAWTNLFIILAAVGVSYAIGVAANRIWGVTL